MEILANILLSVLIIVAVAVLMFADLLLIWVFAPTALQESAKEPPSRQPIKRWLAPKVLGTVLSHGVKRIFSRKKSR